MWQAKVYCDDGNTVHNTNRHYVEMLWNMLTSMGCRLASSTNLGRPPAHSSQKRNWNQLYGYKLMYCFQFRTTNHIWPCFHLLATLDTFAYCTLRYTVAYQTLSAKVLKQGLQDRKDRGITSTSKSTHTCMFSIMQTTKGKSRKKMHAAGQEICRLPWIQTKKGCAIF